MLYQIALQTLSRRISNPYLETPSNKVLLNSISSNNLLGIFLHWFNLLIIALKTLMNGACSSIQLTSYYLCVLETVYFYYWICKLNCSEFRCTLLHSHLNDCHPCLAYFCNIWELCSCISQDFTVSGLFYIPWKIPKHRKQTNKRKKKVKLQHCFFFQVSYLCYWCALLGWWENITTEAWVKFISKE